MRTRAGQACPARKNQRITMRATIVKLWLLALGVAGCGLGNASAASTRGAIGSITLDWDKNYLQVSAPRLPGGPVRILWWEAFCRKGSTHRRWQDTTIPHRTELLSRSKDGQKIRLRTRVEPDVWVEESIEAGVGEVKFDIVLRNRGSQAVDLEWCEPCIRVDRFTGLAQSNYTARCFIYDQRGRAWLDRLPQTVAALYRGGQVYVPPLIHTNDVNPRPISAVVPGNGLMGCVSADGNWVLATAWNRTQHLFQGVVVCIHSDPHVGGLGPGERRRLKGRLYLLPNDPEMLLERYRKDFGKPGLRF